MERRLQSYDAHLPRMNFHRDIDQSVYLSSLATAHMRIQLQNSAFGMTVISASPHY
jgi:hypothetical protein